MPTPELASVIYQDGSAEIWHADSLRPDHVAEIMGKRVANALVVDAPYSEKTHSGHKNGKLTADRAASFAAANADNPTPESRYAAKLNPMRNDIKYAHWTPADVAAFVSTWTPKCRGWQVSITDDPLAPHWQASFKDADLYPFAPLPLVETGSRVRMAGDGPSGWTCWIVVARPKNREFASWGTLPGAYIQPAERDINSRGGSDRVVGGKPLRSMMAIVRDYSRPGDLIVDPCVGGGTCGVAAKAQGRRFIGIDSDLEHCELSAKKLAETKHQTAMPWAETA